MTCAKYVAELSRGTKGGGCLGAKIRRMVNLAPRESPGEEEVFPSPLTAAPGVSLEHKEVNYFYTC